MAGFKVNKFVRINPGAIVESSNAADETVVTAPAAFISSLRPGYGIVAAAWDDI